jgi:hypothetical protein
VRLGRTADSPALLAALPTSEIVTKMLTFAALTLVAGGLLARMAHIGSQLVSLFRLDAIIDSSACCNLRVKSSRSGPCSGRLSR